MKKLWEGRFTKNTNALLEKFNASITFDKRMYAEDIKGSIAHSKMLSKQEIISQDDQLKIEKGLNQIKLEIENGEFIFKIEDEDIHIGLFAVHPDFQSFGVGKKLLAFAEESANKLWKKSSFVMEVISNRVELKEYYNRRGYKDTETFIEFPKSKYWLPLLEEELKLLVLRKEILR